MPEETLYKKAIEILSIISEINKYISEIVKPFIGDDLNTGNLLSRNSEADRIKEQIETSPSLYWLDKYFAFWVYEFSYSISDKRDTYCALITKFTELRKQLERNPREESSSINLQPIKDALKNYKNLRTNYELEYDDVVIVTAVPVEFVAIFRKLSYVINVFNRNEIVKVLNPDTRAEDLKKRNKIWVEGVIVRNEKWVKVRVILTEEYGSVAAYDSLSNIKDGYQVLNEVILVGVAGHIDIKEQAKIGDLIISDGYYNAYPHKHMEVKDIINASSFNSISYNDTRARKLSEDYNVTDKFNWDTWTPKNLVVERPTVQDKKKESKISSVFKGLFISGAPVIKQNFSKGTLQSSFDGALAVEMECYGCHSFVVNHPGIKLKVIKSVCDWADSTKEKRWQPFCADLASEFCVDYLIAKYGKDII